MADAMKAPAAETSIFRILVGQRFEDPSMRLKTHACTGCFNPGLRKNAGSTVPGQLRMPCMMNIGRYFYVEKFVTGRER